MSVSSTHGANALAELYLPRSFEGFLYINNDPKPTMSNEVLYRSTLLVDTDEEKMYFIGNFNHTSECWLGDDIRTTGQVHFRYLGKGSESSTSPNTTV
jgi:hypothetical protein